MKLLQNNNYNIPVIVLYTISVKSEIMNAENKIKDLFPDLKFIYVMAKDTQLIRKFGLDELLNLTFDTIKSMKMKYNLDYFETSAKDGTNVQKIFEYLIKKIIKTRRLFDKIGLSSNIPIDDIIVKEKEIQKLEIKYSPKKTKKKSCCI